MAPPPELTLFDYGVGNLHSIRKALERAGAHVTVTRDPQDLLTAKAIVLPGVGAFGACMEPLLPVREALKKRLQGGVPCLGVCIGMHLLYEGSDETPGVPGIGLFNGHIRAFPRNVGKVPHMGWNGLHTTGRPTPLLPLDGTHAYFVHSYYAPPDGHTQATSEYGIPFASIVNKGNTFATQFHPEKSSTAGLDLVGRWVRRLMLLKAGAA